MPLQIILDMDKFICHRNRAWYNGRLSLGSFVRGIMDSRQDLLYDLCLGKRIVSCLQSDKLEAWNNRNKYKKKQGVEK